MMIAFLNWSLLANLTLFMVFVVALSFGMGILSKSMALGAWGAFLVWIHLAIETGETLFMSFLWLSVVAVVVFAGAKIASTAMGGGAEEV